MYVLLECCNAYIATVCIAHQIGYSLNAAVLWSLNVKHWRPVRFHWIKLSVTRQESFYSKYQFLLSSLNGKWHKQCTTLARSSQERSSICHAWRVAELLMQHLPFYQELRTELCKYVLVTANSCAPLVWSRAIVKQY